MKRKPKPQSTAARHEAEIAAIRQTLAEAAEAAAEAKREAAEAAAETKKEAAEAKKEAAEAKKEAEERGKEFDRKLAEIGRQWGDYTNGEGELLEERCYAALQETKTVAGIRLNKIRMGMTVGRGYGEYDIVGETGKIAVVMEVKRTLNLADVRRFAEERLPQFAKDFPAHARGKKIIGAMIYERAPAAGKPSAAVREALNAGLLVLRARGKNQLEQITSPTQHFRGEKQK